VAVTLIYYQRKARLEAEFDTFDEALNHAAFGSAFEHFAPDAIVDADRRVDGRALDDMVSERERSLGYW
jgi:hypothetical protein